MIATIPLIEPIGYIPKACTTHSRIWSSITFSDETIRRDAPRHCRLEDSRGSCVVFQRSA